jgi:integrase
LELDRHEAQIFGKEPARSFNELIANYLEAKQQTAGFDRLRHACKPLLECFGSSDVTRLQETHVEQYIASRSKSVTDGTIKRELGTLSAAFNHAIKKHHWRVENPCIKAETPKAPKGRVRYLSHAEAKTLLQVAGNPVDQRGKFLTSQYRSPVLRDFIELALNTGCRKGELLNLKWERVDFSTRLLHLEHTKSGEWQTVPINEAARQVLVQRMRLRDKVCPQSPWVFFHVRSASRTKIGDRIQDVRRAFSTACRRSGIKDFHIHDLRHTFASWLVMNGIPLFEVSKLLRHASIQMTECYAHLAPDHLHNAVDNLGFSARFQHTEKPKKAVASQNG